MSCVEKIEEDYDSESDVNDHWFLGCCDLPRVLSLKVPRGCVGVYTLAWLLLVR